MKIYILKKYYFKNVWNNFDFFVICITYLCMIMEKIGAFSHIGSTISIIRIFRILRIFRLVKRIKTLNLLF